MDLLIQGLGLRVLEVEKMTFEKESALTTNLENLEFPQELFQNKTKLMSANAIVRPSLSYWQDAFRRFRKNGQSIFAFSLALILILFSFLGPYLWKVDPAQQNLNSVSVGPNLGQSAIVIDDTITFSPDMVTEEIPAPINGDIVTPVKNFKVKGEPNTHGVILTWDYVPGSSGYSIYRNEVKPAEGNYGVPLGDILDPKQISFEDTQSLESREYFYVIIPKDISGAETSLTTELKVNVISALTMDAAKELGLDSTVGKKVRLSAAPFGTDSLGRDILARLMYGGRVSLFIGIVASFFSVIFGIFLGGISGFFGGNIDTLLMRFTDLVSGLPFLLFMILLKVILNVGPGESGITAMLISLVILSWTGTARLVRGQILQIRNSEFIQASRMMGAKPFYLILRHMLPNLIGVILVSLTFQIPSAIFTEAFLSFIGLGVAAPATSWGAMCQDAIQSLLIHPYEFFAPAIVISMTVLSFNLLGDGLRDALDPKLRSNE